MYLSTCKEIIFSAQHESGIHKVVYIGSAVGRSWVPKDTETLLLISFCSIFYSVHPNLSWRTSTGSSLLPTLPNNTLPTNQSSCVLSKQSNHLGDTSPFLHNIKLFATTRFLLFKLASHSSYAMQPIFPHSFNLISFIHIQGLLFSLHPETPNLPFQAYCMNQLPSIHHLLWLTSYLTLPLSITLTLL